jgi:hypothetical protein
LLLKHNIKFSLKLKYKKMKKPIKFLLTGLAAVSALALGSCGDDDGAKLPPIDGYNNSGEVAATNLVAHWSFDQNNNEVLSGTAPANTYGTVSTTTGMIGNALQLNQGTLVYPSIAKIGAANSLADFTISLWANVKNNGTGFTSLFGIIPTAVTEPWGNLGANVETGWFPASGPVGDTLVLKANYLSLNGDGSLNGQDNRNDPRGKPPVGVLKSSGKWVHFVIRFNSTTHKLQVFGDGVSIGAYDDRGANTIALNMRTPALAVIGSLAASDIGFAGAGERGSWMPMATASIDDIRIYNTAIPDKDITALFNLGTAGR